MVSGISTFIYGTVAQMSGHGNQCHQLNMLYNGYGSYIPKSVYESVSSVGAIQESPIGQVNIMSCATAPYKMANVYVQTLTFHKTAKA